MALAIEKDSLSGSLRQQTLDAAKRHKASWIELGQYLGTIYKDKLYKVWSFLSFEAYCMKELGIKQTTAAKLLKSYQFLEKEEPCLADNRYQESAEPRVVPHYESVNLLRLAKENQQLTPHDYADLRESVIDEGREPKEVRAQVKKMLSEKEDKNPDEARRTRRHTTIKRLVTFLQSAQRQLEADKLVPAYLLRQMTELADKLEGQLD